MYDANTGNWYRVTDNELILSLKTLKHIDYRVLEELNSHIEKQRWATLMVAAKRHGVILEYNFADDSWNIIVKIVKQSNNTCNSIW